MYTQSGRNKRHHEKRDKMTKAIKLYLDYHTKAKEQDLENYVMLLTLWLDSEARKYDIRTSCKSEKDKHRLHLVLAGKSDEVKNFLTKLRSKKMDYQNMIDDYSISESEPYKGKLPDWGYHDLVVAQRAGYLRTVYMEDIGNILEQLVREKK